MVDAARPFSVAYLADPNSIHTRRWVGYFAGRGHRIWMLTPEGLEITPGLPAGIELVPFVPYTRNPNHLFGAFEARNSIRRALRQLRPDIVHAHYLTVHGWHARMAGFHPYVVTVWGSDVLETARLARRAALFARLTLSSADLVTGDSQELVDASLAYGAKPERTKLVQFGVDTDLFSPAPEDGTLRRELGLEGKRVIFSPRSLIAHYRQTIVVEALAKLPQDVVVVMTRHLAEEPEVAAVEARIAELGVGDRVRIAPPLRHRDMVEMYRMSEAVVSIPLSDGTPVTLLEAMACGVSTVATDVPSVREWLGELDPDALVPVDDAAATARALMKVLSRPEPECAAISARGRELVVKRASYSANMARMEALYAGLLPRATNGGAASRS